MAVAGRILIIHKGTWTSGVLYNPLDVVNYGNNSYICKVAVASSVNPSLDTTSWNLFCKGFDAEVVSQTEVNDSTKVPSSAVLYALYAETHRNEVTGSGAITVTLADKTKYTYTGVTSLALTTGAASEASGFITFGANPTVTVTGTTAGDNITEAEEGEVWEFSCEKGYIVFKNWSAD